MRFLTIWFVRACLFSTFFAALGSFFYARDVGWDRFFWAIQHYQYSALIGGILALPFALGRLNEIRAEEIRKERERQQYRRKRR
jgi:hypothetical protein